MTVHGTFLPEDERPTRELSGAYTLGQDCAAQLGATDVRPSQSRSSEFQRTTTTTYRSLLGKSAQVG